MPLCGRFTQDQEGYVRKEVGWKNLNQVVKQKVQRIVIGKGTKNSEFLEHLSVNPFRLGGIEVERNFHWPAVICSTIFLLKRSS